MKRILVWLALALAAALQTTPAGAQAAAYPPALQPLAQEAKTANLAARILTRYHYKPTPLDDALSAKVFDQYLKALDPEKVYFLQSDIDRLAVDRTRLDDAILGEDLRAPFAIFNQYLQRAAQRLVYARSLLGKGFDFRSDETLRIERKDQPWPTDEAQLHDIWRKRVKNDWLRLKLTGTNDQTIQRILDKRYDNALKRLGKVTSADAFEAFMNAYTMAIEPHTNYMAPRSAEDFDIAMRLSLVGIGAVLMDNDGYATIRELVPGGPASLSGQLAPGDRIVGVAQGASGPMEDVVGWRLDDTVALIRGAANSTVRLDVLPAAGGPGAVAQTVTLVRNTIKLQDQAAKARVFTVSQGKEQRLVGVITLPSFYEDVEARAKGAKDYRSASRDVARLLAELKTQKVDTVLIDLRNNGGGSLREAIALTGLFVGKVPVVQARDASGAINVERNRETNQVWDGPLGVLINRASASASEIFAAAIQDYGRGLIIGESSFGKGTVQTVASLDQIAKNAKPTYGELKMTIAQFFRVNGGTTQLRGVTPDIALPGAANDADYGESRFDNALPWTSIKPADYSPEGNIKPELPALLSLHDERMRRDKDLRDLQEDLARAQAVRKSNVISLNEAVRAKERDALERRLLTMQPANAASAASGTTQAVTSALADDGLQANERKLSTDIAASKTRDKLKDVLLDESVRILSDELALKRGTGRLAANARNYAPAVIKEMAPAAAAR